VCVYIYIYICCKRKRENGEEEQKNNEKEGEERKILEKYIWDDGGAAIARRWCAVIGSICRRKWEVGRAAARRRRRAVYH
jgi:hypothetical protein